MAKFPTAEWTQAFMDKLNGDAQYAEIARNWEGDISFAIEPGGTLTKPLVIYLDLWHGKCRKSIFQDKPLDVMPSFILKAPYDNFVKILKGELHPMQAMMTRKLQVQGNMAVMMRNVPTVLDFVRCAKENTDEFV
jgi:putative sterol carrier protein